MCCENICQARSYRFFKIIERIDATLSIIIELFVIKFVFNPTTYGRKFIDKNDMEASVNGKNITQYKFQFSSHKNPGLNMPEYVIYRFSLYPAVMPRT